MATQVTLQAEKRTETGKGAARRLRALGRVPGVVYGRDEDTVSVSVDAKEAEHLFHAISVENTIVELEVEGLDGSFPTLVREIQVHPYKADLLHVDFYRIQAGVKVEVEIPISLLGVPEGVKQSGGVLQQVIHELPVSVLPSEIPESVEIDVTGLGMNEAIHVYDLDLGDEVEVLIDPDRTVASVVAPKALVVEEEEEELEELEIELEEGELPEGELPEGAEEEGGAEEAAEEEGS
ncbi:MAG: 50S ribosomal protein L25 [Gemmatimonadota bacterium]|jgi:large subunit ribosomal protein L25